MRRIAIAFLFGVLLFHQLPHLPDWHWCLLLPPVLWCVRYPRVRLPAVAATGFLWALAHAALIASSALASDLEGVDLWAQGRVVSLPQTTSRSTRFVLDVDRLEADGRVLSAPRRIRLSWYDDHPGLEVGEQWRLKVRLKRPHGSRNPGGFDYEGWLFQQGIRATGYVRRDPANQRLGGSRLSVDRWRQRVQGELREVLGSSAQQGVITALAIGVRDGITPEQWELLARTGTTHLVAISGLHIGLVAGLAFAAVRRLWAWFPRLALAWPAPKAAAVAGTVAALVYSALAGFSTPTQRALIMLAVVALGALLGRNLVPSRILAVALLLVLVVDPLAALAPGFWLSFAAVAVILLSLWGVRRSGWAALKLQGTIAFGLVPLTLLLFQRASLVAPLANAVAIPWVGFVVVPLTLGGAALLPVWPGGGAELLHWASTAMAALWPLLSWLSALPFAAWSQALGEVPVLVAALGGVVLLLLPRGVPGRWLGVLCCLPLLAPAGLGPRPGEAQVSVLDVGQGLAVVLRTQHHTLVYDTGPRYGEHADAGGRVLVPYLRAAGIDAVDTLIISHADTDHSGGVASLMEHFRPTRILSSAPQHFPMLPVGPCLEGEQWSWDGVDFRLLHPPGGGRIQAEDNNDSCVLRVASGSASLLLPGDIESEAEQELVLRYGSALRAEVVVAPHHGSATSSSGVFLAAVQPRYVLFSTAYRNRFGFPKPKVLGRYREAGARAVDTADCGAILFTLSTPGVTEPRCYREDARRYWHHP